MCSRVVRQIVNVSVGHFKCGTRCKCTIGNHRVMASDEVRSIFKAAVDAVEPKRLIENAVRLQGDHLVVNNQSYKLKKQCYVVAFGKAVLGMAVAIENILGDRIKEGVATVPHGIFDCFKDRSLYAISKHSKIKYFEGAKDNLPDEAAYKGALEIKKLVEGLKEDDLVIVLVSGGGSALLPLPKNGISLHEKMDLIKRLANEGADIMELAKVRKRLSQVKGGGLAEIAYPAKVVTLILSDIVGDPLDYIGGGPTVPNTDKPSSALEVLQKYSLLTTLSDSIQNAIANPQNQICQYAVPVVDGNYKHVSNHLIGNNEIAVNAAKVQASSLSYGSMVLSTQIQGDVSTIARFYAQLTKLVLDTNSSLEEFLEIHKNELCISDSTIRGLSDLKSEKKLCILGGGELSVVVRGKGRGGRNQQLALEFSIEINKCDLDADVTFLSCGTDGIDGPTDAAGAIGTSHLVNDSLAENINPVDYLKDNDSYGFYSAFNGGSHMVRVGHTGTNVMDVHVILINRNQ